MKLGHSKNNVHQVGGTFIHLNLYLVPTEIYILVNLEK